MTEILLMKNELNVFVKVANRRMIRKVHFRATV